jgi:hypothetical protein
MVNRAEAAPLEDSPLVGLDYWSFFKREKMLPANSGGMIDYLLRVLLKAVRFCG